MNRIYTYVLMLLAATAAVACNPLKLDDLPSNAGEFDDPIFPKTFGKTSIGVQASLENKVDQSLIDRMIVEFTFIAEDGTEKLAKRYDRYGDIPSLLALPVGKYDVTAKSLDTMELVSAEPYLYGQTSIEVTQTENSLGSIVCGMKSARISVASSQGFGENFSSWSAQMFFQGTDDYVATFSSQNNVPKFLKADKVGFHVQAIQTGDDKVYHDTILLDQIREGQNVEVMLKVDGSGIIGATLTIDGKIVEIDHDVTMPDTDEELDPNRPGGDKPSITGQGFDVDQVKTLSKSSDFEDGKLKNPLIVVIAAPAGGGIQSLLISIDSPDIGSELLDPIFGGTSFDLANVAAGSELEANLNNLGILTTGTAVKNTPSFTFDLTSFMGLLPVNVLTHNFTVKVTDGSGTMLTKTIKIKIVE